MTPAPALVDPALALASQALRTAGPKQLSELRNAAEKWIGGITTLFGLFGLASLITARPTLTDLDTRWRLVIAVMAAVSVGLAGLAIYRTYRAAYGWPVTYPVTNDRELLSWYSAQEAAPQVQAAYLRDGVRATGGALTALLITVGFLLFAPDRTPEVPLVQMTLTNGSQVCGTLLPTTARGTMLIRRGGDGTAVSVAARSVAAETVVTAC